MDGIWKNKSPKVTQPGFEYNTYMGEEPKPEMVNQIADFFGVSVEEAREFLISERIKIKSKLVKNKEMFKPDEHEA